MRITKKRYLQSFLTVVLVLALVRCIFPGVARQGKSSGGEADSLRVEATDGDAEQKVEAFVEQLWTAEEGNNLTTITADTDGRQSHATRFYSPDGKISRTPIYSVANYDKSFPDSQYVHEKSAMKWGVKSVADRKAAEEMKGQLVYVGASPYYKVDRLTNSIPYLVPRASLLLHDIGTNFYDSLYHKGIPLHQIIVTSVLRTRADVDRLRTHNHNATENSCHLYGTTFDISYSRYRTVAAPGQQRRAVRDDTLKYVLAEVLRDLRRDNRCHVKYEVKQGCFHITVK